MKFIELPVKNFRAHSTRFVLTSLGIAIALGGMLGLVGLSRGFERSWVVFLQQKRTDILALKRGSVELLNASLDEHLAARIKAVPGVASAMSGLGDVVELETGQAAFLAGWPLDSDFWKTLALVEGNAPDATQPNGVVLGQTLARSLGKKPGDSIQLSGRDFRITGISRQFGVIDDRSVMMPMRAMQQLIGREGKATGFHIRLQHPEEPGEMARVQARLTARFPNLSFTETSEFGRNNQITRLLRAIAWASSTIALGTAFIAVLNTLLISVAERTREFGIFCAIGWSGSRLLCMVLLDGLALSIGGSVAGVAIGLICLRWIKSHPQWGALLQPDVTPALVVQAVLMALLLGVLGGLYPAWRATRLNPIDLIRST